MGGSGCLEAGKLRAILKKLRKTEGIIRKPLGKRVNCRKEFLEKSVAKCEGLQIVAENGGRSRKNEGQNEWQATGKNPAMKEIIDKMRKRFERRHTMEESKALKPLRT